VASRLFATKSIDALRADATAEHGLKRALGGVDLMLLGIGAIIGTGIFVLTGQAAADYAGPAVVLSFVVAGIASGFAGLCYAEMASMIPIAGSAYTYSYATMGELVAWIIGWDLILEYMVASAAVSVGWSGYAVAFVHDVLGITLSDTWTRAPFVYDEALRQFHATGAVLNVPAMLVTAAVTIVLVIGIKESARLNSVIVTVKVVVVLMFIAFCARFVNTANWHPFIPPERGHGHFGFSGVMRGAATVFFAYIGFDAVSTAAQETRNPQKDLPFGILGSLAVCTVLYVAVSAVLTGIVPYTQLAVPHPIAVGVEATGQRWLATLVEIGAIAGLSSVMLVMMMGQPRIFFSMATDGLLPPGAARVHPRFGTPWVTTIITGVVVAIAGGLLPVGVLAQLTSVGTLFAFVLVSLGVLILRRQRPDIPRGFRVPGGTYLVPICGALTSLYLMLQESASTLIRLFGWMAIGLVIYGLYGRKHSKLAR
jgi:basic amino acid/polyamine antiporter, APA family